MSDTPTVIFVCEHGAAKSIVAAAYFNKLAQDQKFEIYGIARGTHPDEELMQAAVDGLVRDGLKPGERKPRVLSDDEATNAISLVTFCSLPERYLSLARMEDWKDVPAVSANYEISRDAMLDRIKRLLEKLGNDKKLA